MTAEEQVPSRVQARDEPCRDPNCDVHGEWKPPHWADLLRPAEEPQPHEEEISRLLLAAETNDAR